MRYFVNYNNSKIQVTVDQNDINVPVTVLTYWTQETLDTIATLPRHEEPDPEPPAPQADWTGFNLAIVADPYWQSWNIPADLRNALITTAVVELENKFRTAYQTAKAIVPPSPEAIASWGTIAAQFHIPLIF